jgi:hypothetical protein
MSDRSPVSSVDVDRARDGPPHILHRRDGLPEPPTTQRVHHDAVQSILGSRIREQGGVIVGRGDGSEVGRECLARDSARTHPYQAMTNGWNVARLSPLTFSTSFFALTTDFCKSVITTRGSSSPDKSRWRASEKCSSSRALSGPEDEVEVEEASCSSAVRAADMSMARGRCWLVRSEEYDDVLWVVTGNERQ